MQGLPPKQVDESELISAETDFLFLQAERIRVQILLETME